jgi:hypothetical protein
MRPFTRPRTLLLFVLALALGAVGAAGLSGASFSAQKANPSNTFTAAANFCTDTTLHSVTADGDTYVDQSTASTATGGGGTTMNVQSRNSNRNQRVLVGFTLPTKPANCSVVTATLKLTAPSVGDTGRTLEALQISPSATWSETAVTWNTQPTTTGTAATTTSGTGTRSWTVTSQVQAMYGSTNPNNGFLVKDQTEGANPAKTQTYSTREASSGKPTLEVTFG